MDLVATLIFSLFVSLLVFIWQTFYYWKNLGVYQFNTHRISSQLGKAFHLSEFVCEYYNKAKDIKQSICGLYVFSRPSLLVTDLDIVKQILVKDFNIFPNRGLYFNEKDDPISAHIFNIEDDAWRSLRQKLSPTFTSGKLKMMFSTIDEVSIRLMSTMKERLSNSGNFLDIKDVLARFTTDVIGSTAFGLECNSLSELDSHFFEMGNDILVPRSSTFERFLRNTFQSLARKFHVKLIPDHIANFYMDVTKETVAYREKNHHVKRQDFINLLVEMKQKNILTVEQIAAQSFIFFLAGFETTSSTMSYCMYELSINEDVQDKVRESVREVLKTHDNKFTYDAISDMEYLEQCVNETLRKYPVVTILQRKNNKIYQIPNTDVTLPKNQNIWIPVHAIHYDPEIYPDPQKFNPDRFSQQEINKRHSMAFIPFGEGPRICIGMRFGMLEAKLGLAKILSAYKFTLDRTRTSVPMKISKASFVLAPEEKIFLKMEKL